MPESSNPYENTDLWDNRGIVIAIDRLLTAGLSPACVVLPTNVFVGVISAWGLPIKRYEGSEILVAISASANGLS